MTLPDLEALGAVAREAAEGWGIQVGAAFAMSRWSFVAPAGEDAVVKVTAPDDAEAEHEADALALWNGAGAVRLLRHDRARRVLLLDRAQPGHDLSREPDDEATATAIAVAQRLWRPAGAPFRGVLESVERWLDQAVRERRVGHDLVPAARRALADLSPREAVLVHGDFHHHNILRHCDGWLAIDPKPYLAEPEYDVPSYLWNPWDPVAGRGGMPLDRTLAKPFRLSEMASARKRRDAAALKQLLDPRGLALAVEVRVAAAAAAPLREQDPAQVRELRGDRETEGGQEIRMHHTRRIVTETCDRKGRTAYLCGGWGPTPPPRV